MPSTTKEFKLSLLENYPYDIISSKGGKDIYLFFFKHASLGFLVDNFLVYLDPVESSADYSSLPQADLVLITHSHYDHLDIETIKKLVKDSTVILADKTSSHMLSDVGFEPMLAKPSDKISFDNHLDVEAVAAYNTSEGHTDFHPQQRGDCGYILTIDGARIYLSGDGEPTEQMLSLKNIDVAFLSVNQPYTMTVEQATQVVKTLHPTIFYPYHFGQVEKKTNIAQLCYNLQNDTEVRIRPLE